MITIAYGCGNCWKAYGRILKEKQKLDYICDRKLDQQEEELYDGIRVMKTEEAYRQKNVRVIICLYDKTLIDEIISSFHYKETIEFVYKRNITGEELLVDYADGYYEDILGNKIIFDKTIPKKLDIHFIGHNNCVHIGKNMRVTNWMKVCMGCDAEVTIGDGTTAVSCEIDASWGNIHIGKDCMFSWNTFVRNDDGHHIFDIETGERINKCGTITIGNHCWIGQDAIVLKNVNIGDESIVGARAVVTRDIEHNSVVAGNPARVVKKGIVWRRNWTKLEDVGSIDDL